MNLSEVATAEKKEKETCSSYGRRHDEKTNETRWQSKKAKPGLYANIAAKKARIKAGSGEKMRKVGTKGAPTKQAFIDSAKTAKKPTKKKKKKKSS